MQRQRWLFHHLTGRNLLLAKIEVEMHNDRACFDAARAEFNRLIRAGDIETARAAQLFYYLNRTGFNGLCRFNRAGEYNVPFGRYKTITYARDFTIYTALMRCWEFSCGDFEQIILDEDDFVYADPPYDVPFTNYSAPGFTWRDQVRLAEWLTHHRGPTVVSNQATPRILDLYEGLGFTVTVLDAPRRIACNGNRTRALEMLAFRNITCREVTE